MDNVEDLVQPSVDTDNNGTASVAELNGSDGQNHDDYDFRIAENGDIEISDSFLSLGYEDDQQTYEPNANNSDVVPDVNPAAPQPTEPQYYTEAEIANIGIDKLDPNKIPPVLVPFYKSMQADYTRKTQAVASERKQIEDKLNSMNNPQLPVQNNPTEPTSPQAQTQTQPNYYQELQAMAVKAVEAQLGTEFNELDPLHLTALSSEVVRIQNGVAEAQRRKSELNDVVTPYVSDPRWGEIQVYVDNVLDNLPYSESRAIRSKIESGDVGYIRSFLQTAKDVFYETNGGTTVPAPKVQQPTLVSPVRKDAPPILESGGVGVSASSAGKHFDVKNLKGMNNDELANLFVDMGFTDM